MRRPKGSPDLIVRLQLVLAARSNHQKNRPVTDEFLAEVTRKKPAEITQMLKRNPAFDELLSAEGYCNGHEPELEPLEETVNQLIRLLGVTDILHIKNDQPVAEVPQAAKVDVIETPACPPAEAVDHSTIALAASDSTVLTKPVSVPEPEREPACSHSVQEEVYPPRAEPEPKVTPVQEESAAEEAQAPPSSVPAVTEVATKPASELTCSLPAPVVERVLIPNRPTPPVQQLQRVVVHEVPREALPRGPIRGPRQSPVPVTRRYVFGADEPGWMQSVRESREMTVTKWDRRTMRIALSKIRAEHYAILWEQGDLEFQRNEQEKPAHIPTPEEVKKLLDSLA